MAGRSSAPVAAFLFRVTLTLAALLILVVVGAPLVDNGWQDGHGWRRLVALFAHDATVRRTAVASAVGLAVTSCVFFRVPGAPRPTPRGPKQPKAPPAPPPIVGA